MKQREIKFRNWCKPQEGRIYSDIIPPIMIYLSYQQTIDSGRTLLFTNEERTWIDESDFEDPILMECSPSKSVNNKNIYEGDILSKKWLAEVYKSEKTGAFMIRFHNNPKNNKPKTLYKYLSDRKLVGCEEEDCEIIGNMYQNPELLK